MTTTIISTILTAIDFLIISLVTSYMSYRLIKEKPKSKQDALSAWQPFMKCCMLGIAVLTWITFGFCIWQLTNKIASSMLTVVLDSIVAVIDIIYVFVILKTDKLKKTKRTN